MFRYKTLRIIRLIFFDCVIPSALISPALHSTAQHFNELHSSVHIVLRFVRYIFKLWIDLTKHRDSQSALNTYTDSGAIHTHTRHMKKRQCISSCYGLDSIIDLLCYTFRSQKWRFERLFRWVILSYLSVGGLVANARRSKTILSVVWGALQSLPHHYLISF